MSAEVVPDQPNEPIPNKSLTPERLAEVKSLLRYESSVSFHSARAKESMLLLVAEVERLRAPIPDESAIREQVRRVFAAAEGASYGELEPHDYQEQAAAVVDMLRPLVTAQGELARRVAELEQRLGEAEPMACAVCCRLVDWIDSPVGGWWAHREHPTDGHDAQPIPAEAIEGGAL